MNRFHEISTAIRLRKEKGRGTIWPSMVSSYLGVSFDEAIFILDNYRQVTSGGLTKHFLYMCAECDLPLDVPEETTPYQGMELQCVGCHHDNHIHLSDLSLEYVATESLCKFILGSDTGKEVLGEGDMPSPQ